MFRKTAAALRTSKRKIFRTTQNTGSAAQSTRRRFPSSRNYAIQGNDGIEKGGEIMKEKVVAALEKIRPMLQNDGGDVELVEIRDGIVKVRLQGACAGCPMSQMTLKNGIERLLKQQIPEVVAVESAD